MVADPEIYMHWRWQAACLDADTNIFWPSKYFGRPLARALAFCDACPVRKECLQLAIDTRTDDGVYGGLTPHQRRAFWPAEYFTGVFSHRYYSACGTESGYYRHRKHGSTPCDACRTAANIAGQARKDRARARKESEASCQAS